ncbi:hypothetical protein NECAME_04433 [Necator americanus]|uniref:Uncharacterized protein n=1 Tax=Necator americanus TaxID=51031 RepID=W2SSV9_NECAM|nr:hypothetical protein NECAME_04433 [Necator americanus]ETN72824.1 hypothetical protein NECAME_04433 [Necator americanus]
MVVNQIQEIVPYVIVRMDTEELYVISGPLAVVRHLQRPPNGR